MLTESEPRTAARRRSPATDAGLITAHDVARLLGVPVTWVYEQSRRGAIPTVRLGRYRRYRREAIEEWVAELEAAAGEGAGLVQR